MITVANLKEQTGQQGPHPNLYCLACGSEYSANKSDYFNHPHDYSFVCCNEPMILAIKTICLREVSNEEDC